MDVFKDFSWRTYLYELLPLHKTFPKDSWVTGFISISFLKGLFSWWKWHLSKDKKEESNILMDFYVPRTFFFFNRMVSFATADFSSGNCNISPHKLKFHISVSTLSSYEQQKNISLLCQYSESAATQKNTKLSVWKGHKNSCIPLQGWIVLSTHELSRAASKNESSVSYHEAQETRKWEHFYHLQI